MPFAYGQNPSKSDIDAVITRSQSESDLRFLAADELKGRDTGSPGIEIAARYIAENFRQAGVKPLQGTEDYFQHLNLVKQYPPEKGELIINDVAYNQGKELLLLGGENINLSSQVVFANYGLKEDIKKLDLKDKIVLVKAGSSTTSDPRQFFGMIEEKRKLAKEKGAKAIIELYNSPNIPWPMLLNFLNKPQLKLDNEEDEPSPFPYIWMVDKENNLLVAGKEGKIKEAKLTVSGKVKEKIPAKNVLGIVEGTDTELKNEYVLCSAHYDHVGVGKSNNPNDSIFNGARDNGIGTVAVLNAARAFAKNPPKRSVIFAAWTAEEKGLLGSAWYADHPLVPLNKTVYNLNIDGAGYNDTTIISVIGLVRTSAEKHIQTAVAQYGLKATDDPAPEQGLFDRSDNVSFAKKGIPAPTYSTGMTAFDEEIMKYYHQVADEADGLNFNYLLKYYRSYAMTAALIANDVDPPTWTKGDKYEEAGRILYGK